MSLEFIDGWDHYSNNTQAGRKWDTTFANFGGYGAGRFGGNCVLVSGGGQGGSLTQGQIGASSFKVAGFACFLGARPSSTNLWVLASFSSAGVTKVGLCINASSNIVLATSFTSALTVTTTSNCTVLATSSNALLPGTWAYLELKVDLSTGAVTAQVTYAGSTSVWASGTMASGGTLNGFAFNGHNSNPSANVDDFYIVNSSGSVNNNCLGESRIMTSLPSGDDTATPGTNLLWTPNSGTAHYSRVNESSPDDDTSYNASNTVGQIDTYTYPAISPTGPIAGVQTVGCMRKDDVGNRSVALEVRSGGTNYDGSANGLFSSYLMFRRIDETDPATGSAWTPSGVNAAELGVKLTA